MDFDLPLDRKPEQMSGDTEAFTGLATDQRGETEYDGPAGGYAPVGRLRRQYLDFLAVKEPEIEEQRDSRRYYHGSHWTADEIKILRKRRQPVITYNRIGRKINAIVGMVERLRQDPKAFPRNPKGEDGAEIATQCVRYVLDGTADGEDGGLGWQFMSSESARHAGIDGISGIELKLINGDHDDPDLTLSLVFADDFFYDPRSYKFSFGDSRYMGVAKWIDEDEAVELFPDQEEMIRGLIEYGSDLTQNSDREFKWIMVNERRLRLVEHWYKKGGDWCWCFYVGEQVLAEGISPFRNKRGKTFCRFIMWSAHVDHDADRYGFVRNLKGPQDEVNQRRSKALHISNSRRIIAEKGAVDNVEKARTEWAKPDGWLEINPGKQVKPDETRQELEAQFQFLQDAKNEIESMANVAPTVNGEMPKNISGRAINLLQQGATAELGPFVLSYRDWKLRVYRAIWAILQTTWQAERWIRVTQDQELAQFIQINGVDQDEHGRPAMVNAVGALDVDIILDEGPDVVNMMADTYDVLSGMAAAGAQIPWQVLLELAPIQSSVKKKVLEKANQQDPIAQQGKQLSLEKLSAEVDKLKAEATERRTNSLRHVAQAAHAASEAHVNTTTMVREGLGLASGLDKQVDGQPAQQQ